MPTRSFPASTIRWFSRGSTFFGVQFTTWMLVLLVVAAPALIPMPARGEGKLPARTTVAGINISGMNVDRADALVQSKLLALSDQEFTVIVDGTAQTFLARDIGLTYHVSSDVHDIARLGIGGDYDVTASLNPAQFQSHLNLLISQTPNRAVNAGVVIDGSSVKVLPGSPGMAIDSSHYQDQLLTLALSENREIVLTTSESEPDISTHEAEVTAASVNNMLAQPVRLVAGHKHWNIPVETLREAIVIVPDGDGALELVWDLDPIHPQLTAIIDEIEGTPRTDAWVQDLGYKKWLVPEQGKLVVDRQLFIERLYHTLNNGEHKLEIPVSVTPADKTTEDIMAELGITKVIATGTSVYTGSGPGRTHNVETATYYLDRVLVAPGGTYSFNRSIGSLFSGDYLSAGSYIGGPNEQSLAGGVCQVSTTVFRAALNSGFPIVERWPHFYRTIYYEMGGWDPGYEAAIAQDEAAPFAGSDLRFSNPTDSWLLITATAEDGEMIVQIHGSDTGYRVEFSETKISVAHPAPSTVTVMIDDQLPPGTLSRQEALDGLSASFTRRVYDRNGKLYWEDTWSTIYLPTETIIRASPDMEEAARKAAAE